MTWTIVTRCIYKKQISYKCFFVVRMGFEPTHPSDNCSWSDKVVKCRKLETNFGSNSHLTN